MTPAPDESDAPTLGHILGSSTGVQLGPLLIGLAAPCLLPVPGVGNVMGVALMMLALALWSGHHHRGLPRRVADFRLPASAARRLSRVLATVARCSGRWGRPRWAPWAGVRAQQWSAPVVALMGAVIFLPIPLGNVLPALAVMAIGAGVHQRDGLAVALGWLLAIVAVLYTATLGWGASYGVWTLLTAV